MSKVDIENPPLAKAYLAKAEKRMLAIDVLHEEEAYSDVVREAQEVVELATKGMLYLVGIHPPRLHDESRLLLEHRDRFPRDVASRMNDIADISRRLRKDREKAFYGDKKVLPTTAYSAEDSSRAKAEASLVVSLARKAISPSP